MDKMHADNSGFAADWILNYEIRKTARKSKAEARVFSRSWQLQRKSL
jgi:hypothetical protein